MTQVGFTNGDVVSVLPHGGCCADSRLTNPTMLYSMVTAWGRPP